MSDRVAVFHAHPDDEVFATAAAATALSAAGAEVRLWIATGGELPEQSADPDLDQAAAREIRTSRLDRSCRLLGISSWRYLTEPGQWIDGTDPARTLAAAPTEVVAAAVRSRIDDWRPEVVLSVGPDGLTGHPDHIAMHDAVAAALSMTRWAPREALGAVLRRADVRAAHAAIRRLRPDHRGEATIGVPATQETRSLRDPGVARKQAMDLYLAGLGSDPLRRVIEHRAVLGTSIILRSVFDVAGWDVDRFVGM